MRRKIELHDKTFEEFISNKDIEEAIAALACRINNDYRGKEAPIFLGVLNGAFMFMGELMQRIDIPCELSFVKLTSYHGTTSTGRIKELIGLGDNIFGRHIIVVEDIVDTGESIRHLMRSLVGHEPASVEVATLLLKSGTYKNDITIKYAGMEVGDDFIVGFGLDYNQLGRNLKDIYIVVNE